MNVEFENYFNALEKQTIKITHPIKKIKKETSVQWSQTRQYFCDFYFSALFLLNLNCVEIIFVRVSFV